jgi:molybdopterin/thiamine biosynthesis adenylyltransferase
MDNRYIRQSGLVDPAIFTTPVTVIGTGGIGSFTVLTLAKMGFNNITVCDDDTVEEHNLASQFYRDSDIGKPKVEALEEIVKDFCGVEIQWYNARLKEVDVAKSIANGVVIPAVDNMATRKLMFDACSRNPDVKGIVDGRMGGNQAEVYTINNADTAQRKMYSETLWSDEEASEAPCTEKAVMYNVLWISSIIANSVRQLLSGVAFKPINIMDLQNNVLLQPEAR